MTHNITKVVQFIWAQTSKPTNILTKRETILNTEEFNQALNSPQDSCFLLGCSNNEFHQPCRTCEVYDSCENLDWFKDSDSDKMKILLKMLKEI